MEEKFYPPGEPLFASFFSFVNREYTPLQVLMPIHRVPNFILPPNGDSLVQTPSWRFRRPSLLFFLRIFAYGLLKTDVIRVHPLVFYSFA